MRFEDIVGQDFIKNHLITSANNGRIAHAQLFVGSCGRGILPMALAYARYLICTNKDQNPINARKCELQFDNFSHPDLHFSFPVATTDTVKKDAVSSFFLKEWRRFITYYPYGSLYDWHTVAGFEKKQAIINVRESQEIIKSLGLKSYDGGVKVMLIWMADKMNIDASNKLLKLIEEPPAKTVLILLAENIDAILDTIKSRCQILQFPPLGEQAIEQALCTKENIQLTEAKRIAHQANGDYAQALNLLLREDDEVQFEIWFVDWVRTAFKAKGNKKAIIDLIQWSEIIAKLTRETQRNFLSFCVDFFRQAMLLNYKASELVFLQPQTQFDLAKFAPFVHGNNILEITKELEDASYHIERNGNAKIIITDLSIKLTRLLHRKP